MQKYQFMFHESFKSTYKYLNLNLKSLIRWKRTYRLGPCAFTIDFPVLIIILATFLLLAPSFGTFHIPRWDEADYMRAAGQAITEDIRFLGSGYKPLHVTAIAGAFSLFGIHDWVGVGLTMLFSLISIYLIYSIILHLYKDSFLATGAALFMALTQYFLYFARVPRPESLFICYSLLCIWFYLSIRDKNAAYLVLAGAFFGAGFWIRSTMALFIPLLILLELLALVKREIKWKIFFKRVLIVAGVFSIFFAGTLISYKILQPAGQELSPDLNTIENYNANSFYKLRELLLSPFQSLNIVFYPLVLWQLTSPLFCILLLIGLGIGTYDIIRTKRSESSVFFLAFVYLFVFLSFFPQHRYKVFYMVLPFASFLAAKPLSVLLNKRVKISFIVLLSILMLPSAWPMVTYRASANYDSANLALSLEPRGLLSSNQAMFLYYGMFSDGAEHHLPRSRIRRIQQISSISELQSAYDAGYDVIILDERGHDVPLREALLKTDPVYSVHNDVWESDPLIAGYYEQLPYMSGADLQRHSVYANNRRRDDESYARINIYLTKDVIQTNT